MSDIQNHLLQGIQTLQEDMTEVKVVMARNTESLEYHVKRTDTLQDIVTPIYKDFLARQAIEEFKTKQETEKKERRERLLYSLKLPGAILAALTALGTFLAWLGSK